MLLPLTNVCAFTPICQEDAETWLDQYLAEAERIGLPFVMYLDRCESWVAEMIVDHPMCRGFVWQQLEEVPYTERSKQSALDMAHRQAPWALHWDADETWERDAREKLLTLPTGDGLLEAVLDVRWVCLWGDDEHARVDGKFAPGQDGYNRTKLYRRVTDGRWEFLSDLVYGPTMILLLKRAAMIPRVIDLACLHHGYKTRELRLHHKERWDRIYGALRDDGKNPYQTWEFICDEVTNPPTVEKHGY